jgi:Flp pilus assembly protein TadD
VPEIGSDPLANARAALAAGRGQQAVQLFQEALAHRAPPMAWSGLGQAYELVGDRDNAIEAYRKFVELRPNLPEAERLRRRIRFLGGR